MCVDIFEWGDKMSKTIKKNFNLILSVFILLHPIIDLITGICLHVFKFNLTFGNIIRIIFLIFVMFSTTFIYKKRKPLAYYFIFGFGFYWFRCLFEFGIKSGRV